MPLAAKRAIRNLCRRRGARRPRRAVWAFPPLGGRCPSARTGADEGLQAPRTGIHITEERVSNAWITKQESYDIAVIGAGHAGIEGGAGRRPLGLDTLCFTVNLDAVGNMPCNPAIGGTGRATWCGSWTPWGARCKGRDRACIQYRLLNRGKGPAVWSLRAQADRRRYQEIMKHTLERAGAPVGEAGGDHRRICRARPGRRCAHRLRGGVPGQGRGIATGTYLGGRTIVGDVTRQSGPDGLPPPSP